MKQFLMAVAGLMMMTSVMAESQEKAKTEAEVEAYIRAQLGALPVQSVKPAPIPGMYEVIVGGQIAYFSADMKYLIEGDIVDYEKRVNLTDQTRNKLSAAAFDGMDKNDYVAFTPKSGAKHVINVFTDVDCGFCRKLHREVPALNEKGVDCLLYTSDAADE